MPKPTSSPWGAIQDCEERAPGIWSVSTASHGGVKLEPARNAQVPASCRSADGWYEEDSEVAIPALVFPEAFADFDRAEVVKSCKDWMPDAYTAITGESVALEESHTLRANMAADLNFNQFVTRSAFGDWAAFVPDGKVGVYAVRASDNAEQWALVDAADYRKRPSTGFVLREGVDQFIAEPENPGRSKAA